jgi:WD40 repeat protein
MGEPMACDHFDAAGGRLLCLDDGIATVMREDTRETIRTVPAVEHVGLTDDGLWWRYDVRVSLDQDGHEPWGARLVSEARAVFAGPDILLASVGDIAILLQPERPGAKQTTFPLHRPEAHWIEDGFLVLPEHDDAVFLTPDGELSPVGLPAQEGAVAGIERLGDATVVVWDRGPALVLDRELNVQHRWSLPPEAHVLATTALDGAIALQTSRHGVLVFDLSGGLLAQVDAVDAVASSGDRLYLTVNGQVQPFRLEHAGPSIWFRDQPLTSMVADAGRLATGDRHGDVSQLHPVPRTRSTRTGVVRSLWWQDDALVAHVVGAPFLLDVSGAEPVELPVEPGKKAVRLGEGYAGIGWTSGLTVYDADGTEDARWRSPVASVRTLSSRGDVALLVGTDGQIERFDVEAGVRPVGTREGARRAIDTDAGVLVGTHAEVVLLGEDDPVWASPLPGGVSALYAQGDRCVVAMDHGLVQVRSCTTGTVQLELDGHDEAVWSLAVDDGHLLTASLDGTLRRWRL